MRTIVYVLKLLGTRSVYYLRQLMPDYFKCLRETSDVRVRLKLTRLRVLLWVCRFVLVDMRGRLICPGNLRFYDM